MQTLDKRCAARAAPVATVCLQVYLQSVVGVQWALTLREEHHLPCAPSATLACTARVQGLALCLASVEPALTPVVVLSLPLVWHAQLEHSKISLGRQHARRASPACTVQRLASAPLPAPATLGRIPQAAPSVWIASSVMQARISLLQDNQPVYHVLQASSAQRLDLW